MNLNILHIDRTKPIDLYKILGRDNPYGKAGYRIWQPYRNTTTHQSDFGQNPSFWQDPRSLALDQIDFSNLTKSYFPTGLEGVKRIFRFDYNDDTPQIRRSLLQQKNYILLDACVALALIEQPEQYVLNKLPSLGIYCFDVVGTIFANDYGDWFTLYITQSRSGWKCRRTPFWGDKTNPSWSDGVLTIPPQP